MGSTEQNPKLEYDLPDVRAVKAEPTRISNLEFVLKHGERDTAEPSSFSSKIFEKCKSGKDVRLGLALQGQRGRTGPGRLGSSLNSLVHFTNRCEDGLEGANLLPIAPRMAEMFLRSCDDLARGSSNSFDG